MFKRDELESGPGVSGDTPGGVFTIRVGTRWRKWSSGSSRRRCA